MKISTFITSLVFLCAGMCCPPEPDHNYQNYDFDVPGLISVQNQGQVFNQNDTLWIKTVIPNTLISENGEEFEINELSENAENASAILNLYLENSFNQPSPIILSENEIVPLTGSANYQYDLVITAIAKENRMENEFGIILKERGNYFLGAAYPENPLSFYIDANNYNQISIKTNFKNQDSDQFRFRVE